MPGSTVALQKLSIRKVIAAPPTEAYEACLRGWRDANFRLPIPPPVTLACGDEATGLGFRLMRVPPFLIERINVAEFPSTLEYGVANPGRRTYPVSHHLGRITFRESALPSQTDFEWYVEWEPLRGFGWLVNPVTRAIVRVSAARFEPC